MDTQTTMMLARSRQQDLLAEAGARRLAATARRAARTGGRSPRLPGATAWQHVIASLVIGFRRAAGLI